MSRKINDKQFNVATKDDYKVFDRRITRLTSRKCKYTFEYVRCNSDCKHCTIYLDPTSGQGEAYGKKD